MLRRRNNATEWVVTFQNDPIANPAERTLYAMLTQSGAYIAANCTGQWRLAVSISGWKSADARQNGTAPCALIAPSENARRALALNQCPALLSSYAYWAARKRRPKSAP